MAGAARQGSGWLLVLLTLAWPAIVYFGLQLLGIRFLAVLLFALAAFRALTSRDPMWWAVAAGTLGLSVLAFAGDQLLPLKLYPVLVNVALLGVFAISLWKPPSAIERLARLTEPDLPPAAVQYTRRVTQVWCAFFVLNGGIALVTALWLSAAAWALYNGLIAYLLMGLLFGGEWLVRRRLKARLGHG
jgi:uncharacterized membrane protein